MKSIEKTLFLLQRSIDRSLSKESLRLLGPTPRSIVRYRKALDRELAGLKLNQVLSRTDLIRKASQADIIGVGDFHADPQASRSALRVLRDLILLKENAGVTWFLGLEMVSAAHQSALDQFSQNKLSTTEFLDQIGYQENWGFPWSHYEPLLNFARSHSVTLVALNRPLDYLPVPNPAQTRGSARRHQRPPPTSGDRSKSQSRDDRELAARDEWAAAKIVELTHSMPRSKPCKWIVLYGEAHLADCHLPEQCRRMARAYPTSASTPSTRPWQPKIYVIHQNHEPTYWRLQAKHWPELPDALRVNARAACIFPSTPWGRKQALLDWLAHDPPDLGSSEEQPQDALDQLSTNEGYWLDRLGETLQQVARLFGLDRRVIDNLLPCLTLKTAKSADFLNSADLKSKVPPKSRRFASALIKRNQRFYLPQTRIAFIASPSMNRISEMAGRILFLHLKSLPEDQLRSVTEVEKRISKRRLKKDDPENEENLQDCHTDFWRQCVEHSVGYAVSLLLNPKRKCDLLEDHRSRIRVLYRHPELASFSGEKQARTLAVKIWTKGAMASGSELSRFGTSLHDRLILFFTARYLGQMTGRAISLHPSLKNNPNDHILHWYLFSELFTPIGWTELHSKTAYTILQETKNSAI